LQLFVDEINPRSRELAKQLRQYESPDASMIVSLGGDGTMLRAIRKHWRDRLPFLGINTGGLGFLLSGRDLIDFCDTELLMYHLPLLRVELEFENGTVACANAFNDAWVERATGQTAWVRILVNGEERVKRLVGDGVLISTAAGSNSYARAMGATPLPLNIAAMILVGSNVLKPTFWKPVMLPLDSEIVLESIDAVRRPLRGFIDGEAYPDPVRRMTIRASRTAAVELAFTKPHDPVAKLGFVQFPKEND
jgi:NAD kinase